MENLHFPIFLEAICDEDEDEDEETSCDENNHMTNQSLDNPVYQNGFCLWECTDERCVLQFRRRSDRDNHLDMGKHKFEPNKMVLVEKAKLMYKSHLDRDIIQKNVTLNNFDIVQSVDQKKIVNTSHQGWALPAKRVNKRFNSNQREYLINAYDEGEKTGFKMNPSTLSIVSVPSIGNRIILFFRKCSMSKRMVDFVSHLKNG